MTLTGVLSGLPVIVLTTIGANQPSYTPDGKWIIFWSSRDGNPELYVMNADNMNQTRLTDNAADDTAPMWQPAQ